MIKNQPAKIFENDNDKKWNKIFFRLLPQIFLLHNKDIRAYPERQGMRAS